MSTLRKENIRFEASVQGRFNQGNVMLFGNTAGRQCSCCALISICVSAIKQIGRWNADDLDFIVIQGDDLYKSLNSEAYLLASELPQRITLLGSDISLSFLDNRSGLLCYGDLSSFLTSEHLVGNGLIFFIKDYCVSVIWTTNFFFLFDSHSKDIFGQSTPDGFSTLLKFKTKTDLEMYLISTYVDKTDMYVTFETQSIYVDALKDGFLENMKIEYSKAKDRKRKANSIERAKSRERNATDSAKAKCRERNASESAKAQCRKRNATETSKIKNRNSKRVAYALSIGSQKHADKKKKALKNKRRKNIDCVSKFKEKIQQGPYYICVVCNRCLYRRTVKLFKRECYKHEFSTVFTDVTSYDGKKYVCVTCDQHLMKGAVPCQAVWNRLEVLPLPAEIECLNRLEKTLIAKRILFKKISIMPKGQMPKIKGAVCNVPVNANAVNNVLPQGMDSSGLIFVKLKRKLQFRGHVIFENVRPNCVQDALEYLKANNPLYADIFINMDSITKELLSLADIDAIVDQDTFPIASDETENNSSENELEDENPLNLEQAGSDEICLIPNIYNANEGILDIAPGEGKQPVSFFVDDFCEELAFPYLLPSGKFGYKVTRPVALSATKYFNQRLLNFTQRFASNADYIFFAHYVMQQINLLNQINVATRKVHGEITAGQLKNDFKKTVQSFMSEDQGFLFMKSVKGTPAYWKGFLNDVLAMVKQLNLQTFFLTLSCADLRWDELLVILARLNNVQLTEEDFDYLRKCELLNQNPVFTARHFQFRVETFFKEILLNKEGPMGKVEYYVIKVEFQFRGSPHIHSFLWVPDAPILTKETKDEYVQFVDNLIRTDLPDPKQETELHKLVSQYQIHRHSNSCRKYKNIPCRFQYGRFFTDHTIIAEPLDENMSENEQSELLKSRKKVLESVKAYIDSYLDPSKASYVEPSGIPEILKSLGLTTDQYYQALSISPDQDFQIHFRRPPNSCFVNNYFDLGLRAWQANMDIQPVFNYYKAVAYMCSYFSKSESDSAIAMRKAFEETRNENTDFKNRMKKLAAAFLTNRQCSVQEAVYQLMPELWLRKCFPRVVFANSNLPEKRYRVCKNEEELKELPEDSMDVFKKNNLDRYMDRPDLKFQGGKYSILDRFCYADFLAYYVLDSKPRIDAENDNQPEVLLDDDNNLSLLYPLSIPLMSSKEKMKCRRIKLVVRYHSPNPTTHPEAYAHHLLMMFYPFRKESELMAQPSGSYVKKLEEPGVLDVVNENKTRFEPWADLVDTAFLNFRYGPLTDEHGQQENDDVEEEGRLNNNAEEEDVQENEESTVFFDNERPVETIPLPHIDLLPDSEINAMIQSLNAKQRNVFEVVNAWARSYVKNLSCENPTSVEPLHVFITGGAGVGKSHVVKTIHASVSKTLSYRSVSLDKPKVLLLAPTGVAAINIAGTTIHSGLGIPVECHGLVVPKLPDKRKCTLRMQLSETRVMIIDECSMMSNELLLHVHQRLNEIFGCETFRLFGGLTVILVGDLYQLPPVMKRAIFAEYYDMSYNIFPLWRNFGMVELTEVMRQRGDTVLIALLNNIRIGRLTEEDDELLKSRFINKSDENFPHDAVHIYAENSLASQHNHLMLSQIDSSEFNLNAIDQIPKGVPNHIYRTLLNCPSGRTGGLVFNLIVKVGARVMLTSNIDISDRLINGQLGTVFRLSERNSIVEKIYVKFDDVKAGCNRMVSDRFARESHAVPLERITAEIRTNVRKFSSPIVKRTQFPLILAWACTCHKVQSLSLDKIIVSFDLLRQRIFNNGQMYVALSRVTSMNGLFLIGQYTRNAIRADENVTREYEYLREHQMLQMKEYTSVQSNNFIMTVCNVRSLRKHLQDIKADSILLSSDMILCTETQINNSQEDLTEELALNGFRVMFNNSDHKFSSQAIYCSSNLHVDDYFMSNGFFFVQVRKTSFSEMFFNVLLVYRQKDMQMNQFLEILQYLVESNQVHIVVGDFNLSPDDQLSSVLSKFLQFVGEPTHISGSLIDHAYIHQDLVQLFWVEVDVKCLFFTDHDAVRISFQ